MKNTRKILISIFLLIFVVSLSACKNEKNKIGEIPVVMDSNLGKVEETEKKGGEEMKEIYLAGGCFWGVDAYMSRIEGVVETSVGYANGIKENPTYEQVCTGKTGHVEATYVKYDENIVSLEEILNKFWNIIDPTLLNRQGGDRGTQYRTGIYYTDEEDLNIINKTLKEQEEKYKKPIVTEIMPLEIYYRAEEYHQDYLEKNPGGYCHIDLNS